MILSIDAGTTGVTVMVVGADATVVASGYAEFAQYYPQPGWVSHDPDEIWTAVLQAASVALRDIDPSSIAGIGITNQRETTVVWNRSTGRPIAPAIVWQCRRTSARCDELRRDEALIRARTGLVCDPYFSGTKIEWLLDNVEGARSNPNLVFGTIDSWLIYKLCGAHATDPSNASRTMLFNLRTLDWDDELCELMRVPRAMLPPVQSSSGVFGTTDVFGPTIPVAGVAGDQQAALFGQACFDPGTSKNTYGTGSFLLMNAGVAHPQIVEGLLSTVAWTIGGVTSYALEGSVFVTGAALTWLRDELGLITSYDEAEPLAASVPDAGGAWFVPALTGLGSPYWDAYARGVLVGLTRGTTKAHVVRAAIEAMAHQSQDVLSAMVAASGVAVTDLRVDGGAVRMDLLCQLQADVSQIPVLRPVVRETTALGAAFLAGLATDVWDMDALRTTWRLDRRFEPGVERPHDRTEWRHAVERARAWAQ